MQRTFSYSELDLACLLFLPNLFNRNTWFWISHISLCKYVCLVTWPRRAPSPPCSGCILTFGHLYTSVFCLRCTTGVTAWLTFHSGTEGNPMPLNNFDSHIKSFNISSFYLPRLRTFGPAVYKKFLIWVF